MKKLRWILVVLLLAGLACSTLSGGDDPADNTLPDPGENAGSADNSTAADDDSAEAGGDITVSSDIGTDSACYTAYFPVNRDVSWTYEISSPASETIEYQVMITDVSDDSFTSTSVHPNFSAELIWQCGPDGLFSSDFSQFDLSEVIGDVVDVGEITIDGVTLPKDDLWAVGYSWITHFELSMDLSVEGIAMETFTVVDITNTITAVESVTVPAGTFPEAYRVEQTGSITMNMMGVELPIPINTTTWYVKNVGMIKSVSEDEFGTSTTVLVSVD
ncbi:MAG TPA: hypothetical protein VJ965_10160 [Anaerolineales bacterium]|nr:hypothetical protein [Anaerolineales bacterium]